MPFEIVRNDITKMAVDAIVNTANPDPVVGTGVDAAIHAAAGAQLLQARRSIGPIERGQCAATEAFRLPAKYVLHTVGPVWQGGDREEEACLQSCYHSCLQQAAALGCDSIAFPLISAGNYGFPPDLALEIAIRCFRSFLSHSDMTIYLVVFGKETLQISRQRMGPVKSYVDENYVQKKLREEYSGVARMFLPASGARKEASLPAPEESCAASVGSIEQLLEDLDAGFSETLLQLIDRSGKKDSEIYKKANVDRKLFSKIRNDPSYKPSKTTALAFAIALELDLQETKDFIARAGFALSHSSKFDVIIEYFIQNKNYDIFDINETLFAFDQRLLGA